MARPSIFDRMNRMQRQMDKLFENFTDRPTPGRHKRPSTDYYEDNGTLVIEMDLPGVDKNDIDVELRDNQLHVTAQRRATQEAEEDGTIRRERSYKGYKRTVPLPRPVETDNAEATYNNGVLEITIPTIEASADTNKIAVE